jgi:hypothetical protein
MDAASPKFYLSVVTAAEVEARILKASGRRDGKGQKAG